METLLRVVLFAHICAGTLALLSFWLPLMTNKGGRAHRYAGWVFTGAMAAVSVSALGLCAMYIGTHHPLAKISLLLSYVAVMAGVSTRQGIRALRARKGRRVVLDVALPVLLALTGAALGLAGIAVGAPALFGFFGLLGIVLAVGMLRYWLRPPRTPMDWFLEHMASMIGASITALTAFAVVNAPRFGVGRAALVVWVAPVVVLSALGLIWRRHYQRKLTAVKDRRARPLGPSAAAVADGRSEVVVGVAGE
jgi:uncharacterized membrane protein